MFKSTFAKYITAFILIIFLSFLILSGIIGAMIDRYADENREEKLALTSELVIDFIDANNIEDIKIASINGILWKIVEATVRLDPQYDILLATPDCNIILSTVDEKEHVIKGENLGTLCIDHFEKGDGAAEGYLVHKGDMEGFLPENSLAYAKEIISGGKSIGYVVTLASTAREDKLVSVTTNALINSSLWVMLAAVIAAYFITERIIHPLKVMTRAASEMAKGDFSVRVAVYGKDEVSELGRAFNHMAESLDSLEKMRNSFLANVSHDLRTPMTTISGFIEGITSGAIPPEKHDYYLGVISAEVHRLSRLVSQLLDISKLESGERKFTFTDFDIAELSRIVLISFEQKIDDKRLDVEFIADDDMIVNADKDAIHQVMYNLCHNAIKFAKEGGRFVISITKIHGKKIRVSVFDEGQSIAKEDAKMVFDRFYKTDTSRGLDKSGVGLGLYICKTIIDAHDEEIWVESIENESCEFIFTLKEGNHQNKKNKQ